VVDEITVLKECREWEGGGPWSIQGIDHNALESDRPFSDLCLSYIPLHGPLLQRDPSKAG
jgi:hypothetical protein